MEQQAVLRVDPDLIGELLGLPEGHSIMGFEMGTWTVDGPIDLVVEGPGCPINYGPRLRMTVQELHDNILAAEAERA